MIEKYIALLKNLNLTMGLNEGMAIGLAEATAFLSSVLLAIGIFFLIKFILKKTVYKIIQRSTNKYDDLLLTNKVIGRICLLVPALLIGALLPPTLPDFPDICAFLTKMVNIIEIVIFVKDIIVLILVIIVRIPAAVSADHFFLKLIPLPALKEIQLAIVVPIEQFIRMP